MKHTRWSNVYRKRFLHSVTTLKSIACDMAKILCGKSNNLSLHKIFIIVYIHLWVFYGPNDRSLKTEIIYR